MIIAILGWGSLLWEPGADIGNSIELSGKKRSANSPNQILTDLDVTERSTNSRD